jgi:mycothiol synthase
VPITVVEPADFAASEPRVAALEERARRADGHPSLGEGVWRDLEHPARDSAGFFADELAFAHVARNDNFSPRHWSVGIVVDPSARSTELRRELLKAVVAHVAAHGGGRAVCWVLGATDTDDVDLRASGFEVARGLYELRVPLPIAEQPKWPEGIEVRDFEPGRDEAAWLSVNNRAFANHAEQGGWIADTLARRMADPWFDPSLFLLAVDAEGLAGFNWCKIHDAHGRDPRLGEIFVIGVDPRTQGTGLGRALAIAGLQRLHDRGVTTGMLFTDADNAPALKLYRSLGFDTHRIDRAYEREVAGS